jgi:hypothetical protein
VAETLATNKKTETIEGYDLIPSDLQKLNQAKIFEIVVYNLLHRDMSIGSLSASDRLRFLRSFALFLQRKNRDVFATPDEVRALVERLFQDYLKRTDTPQQLLENYYRACRRHSGLTTEGQFLDTSGNIDAPVDEADTESRVGFSHNSLREYLAADALADHLVRGTDYPDLSEMSITDLIGDFLVDISSYQGDLVDKLKAGRVKAVEPRMRQLFFMVVVRFLHKDPTYLAPLLGDTPLLEGLDLARVDLSGLPLRGASFRESEIFDTDLRKSDLRGASFRGALLYQALLDGAFIRI